MQKNDLAIKSNTELDNSIIYMIVYENTFEGSEEENRRK